MKLIFASSVLAEQCGCSSILSLFHVNNLPSVETFLDLTQECCQMAEETTLLHSTLCFGQTNLHSYFIYPHNFYHLMQDTNKEPKASQPSGHN